MDRYYLGTHEPAWLATSRVPLFVSRRRLARRVALPCAGVPWALDSGGFSELSLYGAWRTEPQQYAAEAERWHSEIGRLQWASPCDWMCEPGILARTGLDVRAHQQRSVNSYLLLRQLAPGVPWAPVLQGWTVSDYLRCAALYELCGIRLDLAPAVGVGSVCRRQGTAEATAILTELHAALPAVQLHAFGFKSLGLPAVAPSIASSDSLAWSLDARRLCRPWCGSRTHATCANCYAYAEHWYRLRLRQLCKRNGGPT